MMNAKLPTLLRAMASGSNAKAAQHDVILEAAADEIEAYRSHEPIHAHSIGCSRCSDPDCNKAHLALFNEDDDVIATAIIDEQAMAQLIAWYQATENGTRQ
jgi:hypothetical protein